MTAPSNTLRRGGLDWTVPNDGRAADVYAVAQTVTKLLGLLSSIPAYPGRAYEVARHATRLHVISGLLHRLAERQCNEDLACKACEGIGGFRREGAVAGSHVFRECPTCAGTGSTVGRREKSLQDDAREIAEHYGLVCSFGGLVDGGLVIGTPEQLNRVDPEAHGHVIRRLS